MPTGRPKPFVTEFRHVPRERSPLSASEAGSVGSRRGRDRHALRSDVGEPQAEPLLEASEIQGNIVPGFNKDHQHFIFGKIADVRGFREWIGRFASQIATLEEVTAFNRLFAALRRRRGKEGSVQATWVNIAFSYQGLQKVMPAADVMFSAAFKEGMHARIRSLGDVDDPEQWLVGGPRNLPDLVVVVAGDDREDLAEEVGRIKAEAGALRIIFEQAGETLPAPFRGHEHFGFSDGISQPGVRGRLSTDPAVFLTPRSNPANPDQGKPGQDLIWPGEFILGYPDEVTRGAGSPASPASPAWTTNGSYLVFRRYRQDVDGFRRFLPAAAAALARQHPAFAGIAPEKVGALLMGRWTSGAPLLRAPDRDDAALGRDACANNNFGFVAATPYSHGGEGQCDDTAYMASQGDPLALLCPLASHVRKANPRDDLAPFKGGNFNRNRILRRGVPYGNAAAQDHGLLFLCYQASIERQFEFIMRNWINDPDFRQPGEGYDPIISQAAGRRTMGLQVREPGGQVATVTLDVPVTWAVPTGGAYFFAPSVTALKALAGTSASR
jgi:Dyp-type peroxidase family